MDITRRCDYACRILQAAYRNGDSYMSVSEIADQEDIPYAFARSIQHDLVKSGLIKTVRGAHGGLVLDCDPNTTTVRQVLEAVQGPVCVATCSMDPESCHRHERCTYNKVWQGADALLNSYLGSITLASLFEQGAAHPSISAAKDSDKVFSPESGVSGETEADGACQCDCVQDGANPGSEGSADAAGNGDADASAANGAASRRQAV